MPDNDYYARLRKLYESQGLDPEKAIRPARPDAQAQLKAAYASHGLSPEEITRRRNVVYGGLGRRVMSQDFSPLPVQQGSLAGFSGLRGPGVSPPPRLYPTDPMMRDRVLMQESNAMLEGQNAEMAYRKAMTPLLGRQPMEMEQTKDQGWLPTQFVLAQTALGEAQKRADTIGQVQWVAPPEPIGPYGLLGRDIARWVMPAKPVEGKGGPVAPGIYRQYIALQDKMKGGADTSKVAAYQRAYLEAKREADQITTNAPADFQKSAEYARLQRNVLETKRRLDDEKASASNRLTPQERQFMSDYESGKFSLAGKAWGAPISGLSPGREGVVPTPQILGQKNDLAQVALGPTGDEIKAASDAMKVVIKGGTPEDVRGMAQPYLALFAEGKLTAKQLDRIMVPGFTHIYQSLGGSLKVFQWLTSKPSATEEFPIEGHSVKDITADVETAITGRFAEPTEDQKSKGQRGLAFVKPLLQYDTKKDVKTREPYIAWTWASPDEMLQRFEETAKSWESRTKDNTRKPVVRALILQEFRRFFDLFGDEAPDALKNWQAAEKKMTDRIPGPNENTLADVAQKVEPKKPAPTERKDDQGETVRVRPPTIQKKPVTEEIAKEYRRRAGGDRGLIRQMLIQDGYSWE